MADIPPNPAPAASETPAQVGETSLGRHVQRPPEARRQRRAAVARLLLDSAPVRRVLAIVAERFDVSPSAVKLDVRAVIGGWVREDGRAILKRRATVWRRLERNANRCLRAGDYRGERDALALMARIVRMIQPASLNVNAQAAAAVAPATLDLSPRLPDAEPPPILLPFSLMLPTDTRRDAAKPVVAERPRRARQ